MALDANKYARFPASVSMQFRSVVAVTPSDSTDLPNGECRGLKAITTGNVAFIAGDDSASVTPWPVSAGDIIPGCIKRVLSTGTTATVNALY